MQFRSIEEATGHFIDAWTLTGDVETHSLDSDRVDKKKWIVWGKVPLHLRKVRRLQMLLEEAVEKTGGDEELAEQLEELGFFVKGLFIHMLHKAIPSLPRNSSFYVRKGWSVVTPRYDESFARDEAAVLAHLEEGADAAYEAVHDVFQAVFVVMQQARKMTRDATGPLRRFPRISK